MNDLPIIAGIAITVSSTFLNPNHAACKIPTFAADAAHVPDAAHAAVCCCLSNSTICSSGLTLRKSERILINAAISPTPKITPTTPTTFCAVALSESNHSNIPKPALTTWVAPSIKVWVKLINTHVKAPNAVVLITMVLVNNAEFETILSKADKPLTSPIRVIHTINEENATPTGAHAAAISPPCAITPLITEPKKSLIAENTLLIPPHTQLMTCCTFSNRLERISAPSNSVQFPVTGLTVIHCQKTCNAVITPSNAQKKESRIPCATIFIPLNMISVVIPAFSNEAISREMPPIKIPPLKNPKLRIVWYATESMCKKPGGATVFFVNRLLNATLKSPNAAIAPVESGDTFPKNENRNEPECDNKLNALPSN